MTTCLQTQNLLVRRHHKLILADVDIAIEPGEMIAVVGPSGAGKSTLLGVLSGEIRPTSGTATLAGRSLSRWSPKDLALRRAVLPQASRLNFPFPVMDVVLMGRAPHRGVGDERVHREIAAVALQRAGVEHLAGRDYATLSGGERQRVQFARILAQVGPDRDDPRFVLLDEPTSSLDVAHAWAILRVARALTASGVGVFCILHDLNLAARFADRILLLANGRRQAFGAPREVLTHSQIHQSFGVDVDVIEHPSADSPLVVVRGDAL